MRTGRKPRVAIFLPRTTPFYQSVLWGMQRGFARHGAAVTGWTELPAGEALREFCRQWRPDLVFEMNRCRDQVPELPKEVAHAAWIVDLGGRDVNEYRGSEMLYFFGYGRWLAVADYRPTNGSLVDWLAPGTDPEMYRYAPREPESDLAFVGHIPLPWSPELKSRVLWEDGNDQLTFATLHDRFLARWHPEVRDPLRLAREIAAELAGEPVPLDDLVVRYDLTARAIRLHNRHRLISAALSASPSLRLYGPENWQHWPEFAPFYRGFLADPQAICRVYQATALNLHEGVGPHFRTYDCMAAGGLLFYRRNPNDHRYGEMDSHFEPGVHYLPFDPEEMAEVAARSLADLPSRRRMTERAATAVHAAHTWSHRAEKILSDFGQL